MPVTALSATSATLGVGDRWVLSVEASDVDDVAVETAPTVTVTLPDASTATPTAELISAGVYRAVYSVASTGRYTARVVSSGNGAASFEAYVAAVTANADMPSVDTFKAYARMEPDDDTLDAEIADALSAETADQRRKCRIPAEYPADLRDALHRRIARNLAMRGVPLAVLRGDAESGSVVLPGRDPEVRRLEAGHLRLVGG